MGHEAGKLREAGERVADADAVRRLHEEEQDEIRGRLKLLYEQVRKEEARYAHLERILRR